MPLVVIKSSGEREPFDRQKLLSGLQRACHKRQVSTQLLEMAVRDIESEMRNRLRQEASSQLIGDFALRRLKDIDQVAYVRFASVYRQFSDIEEFEDELRRLEREPALARGQASLDEHMFDKLDDPPAVPGRRLRALTGGLATTPASRSTQEDTD
jgi:transcriptional repressor NrdR